jgi:AcrR family transcriptional regulator
MASSDSVAGRPARSYRLKARAERQQATRDRIVAATVALHREVGPARTTVADIARRAGVQRLTVYTHFPELSGLLGACQAHFLAASPPPDLGPAGPDTPPLDGLQQALLRLYAWFRAHQAMERNVHRDRHLLPELDALMRANADPHFDAAAGAHARLIAGRPPLSVAVRAMVRLALRFETWASFADRGFADADVARLMRQAVEGVLAAGG